MLSKVPGAKILAGSAVVVEAQQSIAQQEECIRLVEIVPAAILAAAERAAESKEQLTRRRRQLPDEAQIFADGFAIGIAFMLQVWQAHLLGININVQALYVMAVCAPVAICLRCSAPAHLGCLHCLHALYVGLLQVLAWVKVPCFAECLLYL